MCIYHTYHTFVVYVLIDFALVGGRLHCPNVETPDVHDFLN